MKAKFINEKFVEDSDPIRDMGIGVRKKIEEWLRTAPQSMTVTMQNIKIRNKDCKLDSIGKVDISYSSITSLPDYIRFGIIDGDFSCHFGSKKQLKYLPEKIMGKLTIYSSKDIDFTIKNILAICDVNPNHIDVLTFKYLNYADFIPLTLKQK